MRLHLFGCEAVVYDGGITSVIVLIMNVDLAGGASSTKSDVR